MLDTVIANGRVVTPDGAQMLDVGIAGESIAMLGAPGTLETLAARTIDATDRLVIPGGIDPHVHTQWPVVDKSGQTTPSGPPAQVSRAALFGGTTTLIDFAVWDPGMTLEEAVIRKQQEWKDGITDYAFHTILKGNITQTEIEQIGDLIAAGFPSFKVFTTDIRPLRRSRNMMMDMGTIWAVMKETARHGGMLGVHGEDNDLVMHMYERVAATGHTGIEHMSKVHSAMSEDLAFRRVLQLASYVEGAALYFLHVSAATGVAAIDEARSNGLAVYGETLHHFITFNEESYKAKDGVTFHTYPSLKSEADRVGLVSGLRNRALHTVATDELCTSRAIKTQGETVFDATGGHVGVEPRLSVVYTRCVAEGGFSLEQFVDITSANAARILGIYPQKGAIAIGSDADIVVFDPTRKHTIEASSLHESDYSVWDGWLVDGWPEVTILRGQVVVDHGEMSLNGKGRHVPGRIQHAIQDGPAI